jgi:hypothetical protein
MWVVDKDIRAAFICAKKVGGSCGEAREWKEGQAQLSTVFLSNVSADSILDTGPIAYSFSNILDGRLAFADPSHASAHLHRSLDSLLLYPLQSTIGLAN